MVLRLKTIFVQILKASGKLCAVTTNLYIHACMYIRHIYMKEHDFSSIIHSNLQIYSKYI